MISPGILIDGLNNYCGCEYIVSGSQNCAALSVKGSWYVEKFDRCTSPFFISPPITSSSTTSSSSPITSPSTKTAYYVQRLVYIIKNFFIIFENIIF